MKRSKKSLFMGILATTILSFFFLYFDFIFYILLLLLFIGAVIMRFAIKNTDQSFWEGVIIATVSLAFIFGFLIHMIRLSLVQKRCDSISPGSKAVINIGTDRYRCPYVCENPEKESFCANYLEIVEREDK